MSYTIGDHKDGGYSYRVEINGLVMTGWRRGTHADVEEYAKESERMCADRARGVGFQKHNARGKVVTDHLINSAKRRKAKKRANNAPQQI